MMLHFYRHSRVSSTLLLQRSGSFRRFQLRGYAASPNSKDKRLPAFDKSLHSHPSSWSTYIFPAAFLMIAGAGLFVRYNDKRRAIPKGGGREDERNTIKGPVIGGPFRLTDMNYNLVTDRDLRGNWVLMYFGYTSSPDVGPEETQKMAKAIEILGPESEQNLQIKPVFITIDPQRDSPSHLRAYLEEFDPRIVGLTGTVAAIRQIAHEYRVYFKKVDEDGEDYLIQSSHNMYLIDPNMEIARCFGVEYDAEQLSEVILKEVNRLSNSDKQA